MDKIIEFSKRTIFFSKNYIEDVFFSILDENVRDRKYRLLNLKNRYLGKRCFIMGNGPSLNKMDLTLLRNEFVWGTNRCNLLFNRIPWRPAFYTAVDSRVVPDIASDINSLVSSMKNTLFFFPLRFRKQGVINSDQNLFWFNEYHYPFILKNENVPPEKVFTPDASKYVVIVYTVTITALQMAVYLGFNPIYLIGCDTEYKIPTSVKYENNNPLLLISTKDDDENHFDVTYFGKQHKWHDPHPELMIKNYDYAKKSCDFMGIQVYNSTIGGNLETFPRVDYNSLFN